MVSHLKKKHEIMVNHQLFSNCVFFVMFLIQISSIFFTDLSTAFDNCDKQRKILTESYGYISSGDKEYAMDSHCEWLIKANNSKQFITLKFLKMDTECSYDHIYVYDGNSYTSPVLGSFSGNSSHSQITAKSGHMLILLYSDTNYVRSGFSAVYTVTDCPLNCSERGLCINHRCVCDPLQTGEACDIDLCPFDCGSLGECTVNSPKPRCKCRSGYSGIGCSLSDSNTNQSGQWHVISPDGFYGVGRASHSGVYVESLQMLYIFGGYAFGQILGDMVVYDFVLNQWQNLTFDFAPSPRRDHAAVVYSNDFVIYGGELQSGYLSDELWLFNTSSQLWKLIPKHDKHWPPKITKHSLTLVDGQILYLYGGALVNGMFESTLYRTYLDRPISWEKIIDYGGKHHPHQLLGHTAVFYEPSRSIFIYGGVTLEYSAGSRLNSNIYAYHVDKNVWTKINYAKIRGVTPLERAFHSAAVIGDYMVIFGGYTHRHSDEEICYDNETYLYHLKCHKWIDYQKLKNNFNNSPDLQVQGIFAHSMSVRNGHTLLVYGGYSGTMHSQLSAFILPPAFTSYDCFDYDTKEICLSNLACGWCPSKNMCIHRSDKKTCDYVILENCPGICSTLVNCVSCLIWGDPTKTNVISDDQLQDIFPPSVCTWFVQGNACLPFSGFNQTVPFYTGNSNTRWWDDKETLLSTVKECYTSDYPPGLISIKYHNPVNWSEPDDVTLLANASEVLNFRMEYPQRNKSSSMENIVKFVAFIHPLGPKTPSKKIFQQQLHLCSSGSSAFLKLSTDTTVEHLEVVGNHTAKPTFFCSNVHRPSGAPIFPDTSPGHKYLFEFQVNIPTYINQTSMQLAWDAFSLQVEVISYRFLEPYKNGSCGKHRNCLACMTDNACGWCHVTSQCLNRETFSEENCHHPSGKSHYFITHPNDCYLCSDYVYCEDCTQSQYCEWLVETAYCIRRKRFKHAVSIPHQCPLPCHQRTNCSSCLGDPGVCTWCEATQTCFLFSTYTTSYMFGLCRDWVDENRLEPDGNPISLCRNCSRHDNCSQCLQDLNCGWCSFNANPTIGVCVLGDFKSPSGGHCNNYLPSKNSSLSLNSVQWSYGACPDVNECHLGLHNCHPNATCKDTRESFTCECNIGFEGDGKTCIRACAVKCLQGVCSQAPDYKCICQLGWTGEDCSQNCGCNNHSFCPKGLGICEKCENWTEGKYCNKCQIGSYGNALTSAGCAACNCNSHGNSELGYCNSTTGVCFCNDYTEGPNCSKCKTGYYGDPRNGGKCFEECRSRSVITDVTKGRLGCSPRTGTKFDCLWMLTVYSTLDVHSLIEPTLSPEAFIELEIHKDLKISCPHNFIYVYDGLPDFITPKRSNILLGSFCGTNLNRSLTVTATSGYLTIHFKRNMPDETFSASYKRIENFYDSNQTCLFRNCDNYSISITTDKEPCPNNCSGSHNHGICDVIYGKCICENGHAGDDCSQKLKPYSLVWTSVYNYAESIERSGYMPSGRIGHSLLTVNNETDDFENLFLFGGYSPAMKYLNDVFMFETFKRQWIKIETRNSPPPRHFHAAATYKGSFYIFGGLNGRKILGDFWKFDTISATWFNIQVPNDLPPMAGSTLTTVQDGQLLLIGGLSPRNGFFEKIAQYDTSTQEWSYVNSTGAQPVGIYGHSSVYHPETKSIYVFGGVLFDVDNVVISRYLYAFHCDLKHWFALPPDMQINSLAIRPQPMYFHTSVVTKNYMIVFGGRSSNDLKGFPEPYAYIFSCNLWISLSDKDIKIVGSPPEGIVGGSSAVANGDAYFFGGMDGELVKLSTPIDFCQLFSTSRMGCIRHTGCAYCSVHENSLNHTFCYSQSNPIPASCYNPKISSEVVPAASCTSDWIEKRDCTQYSTCSDCVTSWPAFNDAKQVCQWCSNCKVGRCIPSDASCESLNDCNIPRKVINETSACPLRMCSASDCDKCVSLGSCIWTSQVQRSSGFGHMLNQKPIFNWACVIKEIQDAPPFNITSMPPLPCPPPCIHHTNCSSCLQSSGGEGGWHQCLWSETLQSCLSPSYELLRCEDSSCGPVLIGNASQCPVPCWHHEQASHCLAHAHCGWCAFSGPRVDGRGLCMEGGIMAPISGRCSTDNVLLLNRDMPEQAAKWLKLATGPPHWYYLVLPPENECENGHHTCDEMHEECVDMPTGFECKCKDGYNLIGNQCKPTCKQGCANGTCVRPDVCECNFGYVGKNCTIPCKCNGHSNCPGPDKLDVCIKCHNNTQGSHCEKCRPFFVGNPVNSGKCIPCQAFCHSHSSICVNPELLTGNGTFFQPYNQSLFNELLDKVTEGAQNDAVCLECKNHTEGKRCDMCMSGYFKAGEHMEDGCRPCECHGHGDVCNPINGENCNCQNNTENDRQCSQKNSKNITPCWQHQCSKCKEYFLGAPSDGHQCYRHMFLDKDYCFDPNNQEKCNEKPYPLLEGRTVFFAVQPRYMNVDIRIVVDVTEGGIDFLLSAKEDTFIVDVNQTTGIHVISIDNKYGTEVRDEFEFRFELNHSKNQRETTINESAKEASNTSKIGQAKIPSLIIREVKVTDLTTYVTIEKNDEFLLVPKLENRLVITIPQNVHDLRVTRFYMILRGAGSQSNSSTYGSLFFRQDQTRIDLFVFFSVFFSCFFLFLAICVVVWKVKQAFDLRRARRLHAAEMKHMASRPFGHVITVVDDDLDDYNFLFYSPTNCRKKTKLNKVVHGRDSPKANSEQFCLRPIAVEPLTNGSAAVATILVQLPGGAQSLVKMALASALITTRSSHYHMGCSIRAAMRRRTSHVNV